MSRLIDRLALDADAAIGAIDAARAVARAAAWGLAGVDAPDHGVSPHSPLTIDTDATLLTAHSEKEFAAPTYKRGFGFHPLCVFADHGHKGTGEPLTVNVRVIWRTLIALNGARFERTYGEDQATDCITAGCPGCQA